MSYHLIDKPLAQVSHADTIAALASAGCVLLRDPAAGIEDFMRFGDSLGELFYRHEPGPGYERVIGSERGRTYALGIPTLYPVSFRQNVHALPLHGELYYRMQRPPDLLWFYCANYQGSGGETLVCDGKALYRALAPRLQRLLTGRRLVYTRWHSAEAWPQIYGIADLKTLRRYQQASGHALEVHDDASITTRFISDALRLHQGEPCFVNSLLPFALRELHEPGVRATVRFENGEALAREDLLAIADTSERLTVSLPWQRGDIAIVDNTRSLHGRGPLPADLERTLYLRMGTAAFCRDWVPLPPPRPPIDI